MTKLYLVVFVSTVNRSALVKFLENKFWFYCFPNSIFIKSKLSSKDLSALIESHTGEIRHFITEITPHNKAGRLPSELWQYFKNFTKG